MSYTLPSVHALAEAFDAPGGIDAGERLNAVARLAIEHYIAEAVQASGVDVETVTTRIAQRIMTDDGLLISGKSLATIADAIRTAIAQAVARTLYVVTNDPLNAAHAMISRLDAENEAQTKEIVALRERLAAISDDCDVPSCDCVCHTTARPQPAAKGGGE